MINAFTTEPGLKYIFFKVAFLRIMLKSKSIASYYLVVKLNDEKTVSLILSLKVPIPLS